MTNMFVTKLFGCAKIFRFFFIFSNSFFSGETMDVAYTKYKIKRKFTFFFGKY